MATIHNAADKGQIAPSVLMPGDPKRAQYIAMNFLENPQLVSACGYIREKAYFSTAIEYDEEEAAAILEAGIAPENGDGRLYRFIQRNKVSVGEDAELISPCRIGRPFAVRELYAPDGTRLEATPHPSMIYWCRVPFEVKVGDIMRAASGKGLEIRAKDRLKGDCN